MEKKLYSREFITNYISSCNEQEFAFFCVTMQVIDSAKNLKKVLEEEGFYDNETFFVKNKKTV